MERDAAGEQPRADDLVERVVAPDVLAQDDELARRASNSAGGVQAARALEARLHEPVGQPGEQVARRPRGPAGAALGVRRATSSSAPLPQTPHDDDV